MTERDIYWKSLANCPSPFLVRGGGDSCDRYFAFQFQNYELLCTSNLLLLSTAVLGVASEDVSFGWLAVLSRTGVAPFSVTIKGTSGTASSFRAGFAPE